MLTKTERTKKIEDLQNAFSAAKGIYLTDINKLTVEKITQLRGEFRKNGVQYMVVKNTLARIALERCGKKDLTQFLTGPVGVAFCNTEGTVPAKIIRDFHKNNKELLKVKALVVDGTLYDGVQSDKLADIPSREVLLSQLLGCLKAPTANLAGVLAGIISKLAATVDAVREKKEKAGSVGNDVKVDG
jgi:large subunit ribosomal protein L10